MRKQIVERLLAERVVVIIRVKDPAEIPAIVECLVEGGIKAIEITSNTPDCMSSVKRLREDYPQLLVGAGTITCAALADEAINSGAQFLVTPNTRADVVSCAHAHDVPVIMGAMTPSEVVTATDAEADIIKLFPAEPLGPDYLRALARGPFLDTIFFAVGGIDEHNLERWINSGAAGVGIGGSLAAPVSSTEEADQLTGRIRLITSLLNK